MKRTKSLLIAVALLLTSTIFTFACGDNELNQNSKEHLQTEILQLIESPDMLFASTDVSKARVAFTVVGDGEIVVIKVRGENSALNAYLKEQLNHKNIEVGNGIIGKSFELPISLEISNPS